MVKSTATRSLFNRWMLLLGCLSLLVGVGWTVAVACDTPVYRYAMYRWQATPYEVYYFHDAPADESDQRVAALLEEYGQAEGMLANVVYIPINASDERELNSLPPDVKQAWLDRSDQKLPVHFITSPHGQVVAWERLDEASVRALIESPGRKQLAAQLEIGKQGVLVFLAGEDEAANGQAEAVVSEFIAAVQGGQIELYQSPAQAKSVAEAVSRPASDVGFVKLSRTDDNERWFIRTLLASDKALTDDKRPMVFFVYGRARVLSPFIGSGITRDNLTHELEFISGQCSCTVKEQNPGIDLLVRYDWDSAAAALADKFGAEEGNETRFGIESLFADSRLLTSAEVPSAAAVEQAAPTDPTSSEAVAAEKADASTSASPPADAVAPSIPAANSPNEETATSAPTQPASTSTVPAVEAWSLSIWSVGGMLAVAAVVLFALTFLVLRPH